MEIFDCDLEKLAALFSKYPLLYNHSVGFFRGFENRGILSPEVESSMPEIYEFLNQANSMARDSDYFMFQVHDSWAEEQVGEGEGYLVYQKIGDEMVGKLGLTSYRPHSLEDSIKFLEKQKVKRIYTLNIPIGGFFGVVYEETHDDSHIVEREILDEQDIAELNGNGIEVLVLTP